MAAHRAPPAKAPAALMLVGAACVAALIAHVAIDLAGDVVLVHDTYDGLGHGSRSEVFLVALTLAVGALLRVAWLALAEARTGRTAARRNFDDTFGRAPWRFIAAVVALTLPLVMAMEFFDIVADAGRLDDVTDLLGGSAPLGLSITLPVSVLVGQAFRSIAKLVMNSHRALVAVIGFFLAARDEFRARSGTCTGQRRCGPPPRRRSILARRSGKRGPPLAVS